ncbi:hypothetical protein COCON_G00092560 [Conger conger]|uniref:HSR domain-containing protein n=1 Tax=Conger conger TaxID=82655 RepID=A0A9Q1DLH8_CONCO|nr:hypothetical protein COCON_G00092560 [Conger conger]
MWTAEHSREANLHSQLRVSRTEIAMAIDDPFPLFYGLADNDIITEHMFKETLERTRQEGIHKASYSLLSWLLDREPRVIQAFWNNLSKEYNRERYPKLKAIFAGLQQGGGLGGQRRVKKLFGGSKTALQPHAQQGRKRSPREDERAQLPQTHSKRASSPGIQAVATSVQRAVTLSSGELPGGCGAVEEILIKQVFESGAECLSVGQKCGMCLQGGELTACPQCLQAFHPQCYFPSGRSKCRSCCKTWGSINERERPVAELESVQVSMYDAPPEQSVPVSEQMLNKEELDSLMGENSIDGILQWALHNISRPLAENQGFFQ